MKRTFLFSALLMAGLVSQAQTTYKLVWADEFDNSTTSSHWNREVTENPANNELQYYTSASTNVKVEDGNLVLIGRREKKGNKSFTSGRVNSNGKVSFTHGVATARIKLPKTKGGLWPAFWMMGNDISQKGWPYCGEIDIVEWGNSAGRGKEEKYFSAAIHWGENWQQHAYYSYPTTNGYSVQDDYHIWTCEWDENYMRCFLDDQQEPYFEASIGNGYGPYPYVHKPFHLLFNLAIGGDFPGITNPAQITALPNNGDEAMMYIDWVRIYQKEGQENITCPTSANDKSKVPESEQTITIPGRAGQGGGDFTLTPAPTPTYPAGNVRSLFCDNYTNLGSGSFFDTWGSAGEAIRTFDVAAGNKVEEVKNFGWVGFNYNSNYSSVNMSGMDYMHCDIYPSKSMSIGITPISLGPQEYDEIYYDVIGNQWNSIDVRLADFKAANPSIDYSKAFQTKWFGGDSRSTIYIDNIFYFKGEPSGIQQVETVNSDNRVYDLQGRSLTGTPQKGLYISNGRKFIVR